MQFYNLQVKPPTFEKTRDFYLNRKHFTSLNTMIVAGATGRIYSVLSDTPGKFNDASIFRNSALFKLLDEQNWRPFPGSVLLGDSAYMVKVHHVI